MDKYADELTLEMLPEGKYQDMAAAIGTENLLKVCEIIGGDTVYIAQPKDLLTPVRDLHIREEFNGYNHPELAKKYGVSVRWVLALCGQGQPQGQISFFEDINKS